MWRHDAQTHVVADGEERLTPGGGWIPMQEAMLPMAPPRSAALVGRGGGLWRAGERGDPKARGRRRAAKIAARKRRRPARMQAMRVRNDRPCMMRALDGAR